MKGLKHGWWILLFVAAFVAAWTTLLSVAGRNRPAFLDVPRAEARR